MKYFIYCRVSSDREDKQVLGIPSQKKELLEYAHKHKLTIANIFTEKKSAYKTGRKEFNSMLERIEKGEANGILVWHLSRIARNSRDGGNIIYMMDEGQLKEIRTPSKLYTGSGDDKFMMNIDFAMSKKSSDDNSSFVKRDIKSKLEKGEFPAKAPLGYLNINSNGSIAGKNFDLKKQALISEVAEKRPLNRIEQDPIIAPLLRKLFDKALIGNLSLKELSKEAFSLGIVGARSKKKLAKASIDRILKNPFFYGFFKYNNELVKGDYQRLISKKEYDKIQSILYNASRPRKRTREYTFSQMILCGHCRKKMMSGDYQKETNYYRCTGGKRGKCENKKYYREDVLEEQILIKLSEIELPQKVIEFIIKKIEKEHKIENKIVAKTRNLHFGQINALKASLSRLKEKWLSSSNINGEMLSDEEFLEEKKDFQKRIAELEEVQQDSEINHNNWTERAEEFFMFSRQLVAKYKLPSIKDKRAILNLIGAKYVLTDGEVTVELAKPFSYLFTAKSMLKTVRTHKNPLSDYDKGALNTEKLKWRDFVNDIRYFFETEPFFIPKNLI